MKVWRQTCVFIRYIIYNSVFIRYVYIIYVGVYMISICNVHGVVVPNLWAYHIHNICGGLYDMYIIYMEVWCQTCNFWWVLVYFGGDEAPLLGHWRLRRVNLVNLWGVLVYFGGDEAPLLGHWRLRRVNLVNLWGVLVYFGGGEASAGFCVAFDPWSSLLGHWLLRRLVNFWDV